MFSGSPGTATVCNPTAAAGTTSLDSLVIAVGGGAIVNGSGTQAGAGGSGTNCTPWLYGIPGSAGGQGDDNVPTPGGDANALAISSYPVRRSAGGGAAPGFTSSSTADIYTGKTGGGVRSAYDHPTFILPQAGVNTGGPGAPGADGVDDVDLDTVAAYLNGLGIGVSFQTTYGIGSGGQGGNPKYDGHGGRGGKGGRAAGGGGGGACKMNTEYIYASGPGGDGGDGLLQIVEFHL